MLFKTPVYARCELGRLGRGTSDSVVLELRGVYRVALCIRARRVVRRSGAAYDYRTWVCIVGIWKWHWSIEI